MTREAELLIDMWDILYRECHKVVTEENYDVIKKAIKALERESMLDKLRAEIKGMTPTYHNPDWSITDLVPISEVLKLVDKYKGEREVT